ncbi:MAG TPA: LacI family DNA-binding transcriptional regulator [Longimicrobiaceae bacterium]|nr:LacI family DNA-binding transcriptional regulator [Longimicrobiaceae bacterium]
MPKLQDVAELAGVSASTVSRVVNEPQMVNDQTRARVEEAIRALGYRPNRVARRLRVEHGLTNLVGLIIPDLQNPFFADIARGVEDVAVQNGYTVLIGNSDENLDKERRYLEVMHAESVDGIILPPNSTSDPVATDFAQSEMPLVFVDRRLSKVKMDTAVTDNVRGAYDAVEHLIRLGHRRIGFIEGRPQVSTSRERLAGYRQALEDHGIELDPAIVRVGDSRQESGRHLAEELLALPERPTALLVGNGLMALGALEALHRAELKIPDEMAIIGYDDMPWALALNPPLTVVRQPGYELGSRAMELLLQRIRMPERSTTLVVLEPELIVRRSCGAGAQR